MTIVNSSFCNKNRKSDYIHVTRNGNITVTDSLFIVIETASSRDHLEPDRIISYEQNTSIRSISTNVSIAADYDSDCDLLNINTTIITSNHNDVTSAMAISAANKETTTTSEPTSDTSELRTNPNTEEASESTTQATSMVTVKMISTTVMTIGTMVCACCPCCR